MKCRNCGANLEHGYCEYCGSFYGESRRIMQAIPDVERDDRMHKARVKDVIEVTCIGDEERHYIEV